MAIKRFHINPETGTPGVCVAQVKCRFGGEGDHYPSEKDARNAFERKMMRETWKQGEVGDVEALPSGHILEGDTFKLEPGEYFIGDPYLTVGLDSEGWSKWVDMVDKTMGWENDVDEPELEEQAAVGALYNGEPVLAIKSYYGDGLHWSVAPPRRLPSDVGLIGAVPASTVKALGLDPAAAQNQKLGILYTFEEPVLVYRELNGNVFFGEHLMVVHNDAVPEQAFKVLDEGDSVGAIYELAGPRAKTYHQVVSEFSMRPA